MIKTLSAIIDSMTESATTPERIIKTGFQKIDDKYLGICPKELWVLGAYTGSGKTYFALQLSLNIAKQHKRILYFSLEMPSEALIARIWGNIAGIDSTRLEYGLLKPNEFQNKNNSLPELLSLDDYLFMKDNVYSITGMKNEINDLIRANKKPDVVIVDFIQNIQSEKDEYTKLSESTVELQQFAKQVNCSFFVCSQVSNEEARSGTNSKIIGYKGSGGIAAATDMGLWLEKTVDYEIANSFIDVDLYVRKARRGPNCKLPLTIVFPGGKVKERL